MKAMRPNFSASVADENWRETCQGRAEWNRKEPTLLTRPAVTGGWVVIYPNINLLTCFQWFLLFRSSRVFFFDCTRRDSRLSSRTADSITQRICIRPWTNPILIITYFSITLFAIGMHNCSWANLYLWNAQYLHDISILPKRLLGQKSFRLWVPECYSYRNKYALV